MSVCQELQEEISFVKDGGGTQKEEVSRLIGVHPNRDYPLVFHHPVPSFSLLVSHCGSVFRLYHHLSLSPPISITAYLYHRLTLSPPISITAYLYHRLSLSPPNSSTAYLYHRLSLSPPISITAYLYHRLSPPISITA